MSISNTLKCNSNHPSITKAYLEPIDIDRLQQAASNPRDRLLIRLLFHLGCRVSEALSITVDDIEPTNHTITIQHLKTRIRLNCPRCGSRLSKSHAFCPKCGNEVEDMLTKSLEHRRTRTLPIDEDTMTILED